MCIRDRFKTVLQFKFLYVIFIVCVCLIIVRFRKQNVVGTADGSGAVSYTHLDVYKRQELG